MHFTFRRNNVLSKQEKQRILHSEELTHFTLGQTTHFTLRSNNALYTQKEQRTLHSEESANFPLRRNNELCTQNK